MLGLGFWRERVLELWGARAGGCGPCTLCRFDIMSHMVFGQIESKVRGKSRVQVGCTSSLSASCLALK